MNKRRPIVIANWKMFTDPLDGAQLAHDIVHSCQISPSVDVVICPPFVSLTEVRKVISDSGIKLGAQNIFWEPNEGSYTGEISAQMISGLCEYVIVGHSERRQYFDETDDVVNKKVKAGLQHGLQVIICVGESLAQNTADDTKDVIEYQVRSAYEGISRDEALHTVVAYEPIWAIGTGRASTASAANKVSEKYVRSTLERIYGHEVSQLIRIQYGGSINRGNISEFIVQTDIDGVLIGGSSLLSDEFAAILCVVYQQLVSD
jgi:triosephosphate isomerase